MLDPVRFAARRDEAELEPDDPVLALLRELAAAVQRVERKVDALAGRPLPAPGVAAFFAAVDGAWGNGFFRVGELLGWAADPALAHRKAVLDAARSMLALPIGAPVTAHALGLRLSALAGAEAGGLRLVRVDAKERGARIWAVVRVRD